MDLIEWNNWNCHLNLLTFHLFTLEASPGCYCGGFSFYGKKSDESNGFFTGDFWKAVNKNLRVNGVLLGVKSPTDPNLWSLQKDEKSVKRIVFL